MKNETSGYVIPCKECLVYPICRNKPVIICSELFYFRWAGWYRMREQMNEYFPNWAQRIIMEE